MKTGMMIEHETEPVNTDIYAVAQYICALAVIAMLLYLYQLVMKGG